MKFLRLTYAYVLLSAVVVLCAPASGPEIIQGPRGTRRPSQNWNSLSIAGNLGNCLRLARNTPPKVIGSGEDKFHLWEYVSAVGDTFRLVVHSATRTITGAVCRLDDAAFNALTGPGPGREYDAVALITADENAIFTVNMAFDTDSALQRLLPLSNVTDEAQSTERIRAPHCALHKRADSQESDQTIEERSIAAPIASDDDYDHSDEENGAMRVDGYLGTGCTGERVYSWHGNHIDFCHQPDLYNAQSFLVVNPRSGPGHLHVYKDRHCRKVLGRILTQTCIPANEFGSFHRQE